MARFDVPVPETQDPSYLHLSKPISGIEPNKGPATLISGIGSALEEGIKGIDKTLSTHAEYLGEQMGEQEQNDFVKYYAQLGDSLTKNKENVPDAVNKGLDIIQRNQDAYGQGKLRETEYYRNLYEKAKELRAQWPGYRDYIDRGVEKATGITPNANRYIQSLLADINERTSKTNKFEEHSVNNAFSAMKEGAPGLADSLEAYNKGQIDVYELNRRTNKANAYNYQARQSQDSVHIAQGTEIINNMNATNFVNGDFAQGYSHVLEGLTMRIGGKDVDTSDIFAKVSRGEIPEVPPEAWTQIAAAENQRYMAYRAQKEAQYSQAGPKGEQSVRQMMGKDFKTNLDANSEMHNLFQQAIKDHDVGLMSLVANMNKAQFEGALYTTLKDPNFRAPALLLKTLHSIGGDQYAANVGTQLATLGLNILDKNSIQLLATKLALGDTTMAEAFDTVAKGSNDGTGKPVPQAVQSMLRVPAEAMVRKDVPDPIKVRLATQTFGPDNNGLLSKIENDTVVNGRPVQGKYAVFDYYTSPGFASEMKRISEGRPALWEMYKNWTEATAMHDLLGDDVQRLKQIQMAPNFDVKLIEGANGTPQFKIEQRYRSGRATTAGTGTPGALVDPALNDTITRINSGLRSLSNVYQQDGEATMTKARLLQIMRAQGINPNEGNSVARSMLIGVGATKKPAEGKDEGRAPSGSGNE